MVRLLGDRPIPPRRPGSFDHGDVHLPTGRIFVTHTSEGTVEVLDPWPLKHRTSILGCQEGSGLLCLPGRDQVVAASRATGKLLLISAKTLTTIRSFVVGERPNGLAWDPNRERLLVADVGTPRGRLVDVSTGKVVTEVDLPGRPRWCVYDGPTSSFFLCIRDPPSLLVLDSTDLSTRTSHAVPAQGPHGLAIDPVARRAFVATDDAKLVVLSMKDGAVQKVLPLSGPPDVVWHDHRAHRLYVTIGEPGCIDIFDTSTFEKLESARTQDGAHTSALDPTRGFLYAFLPQQCASLAMSLSP